MTRRLENKVALVTGGTSGIGLAAAQRFAAEGAAVFITGRKQAQLDEALKTIPGAIGVRGDIAQSADLDRLFDAVRQKAGRLDVLFANAGGGAFVPLTETDEALFDKYFNINVKGTLFTVQKALPLMGRGGAIVLNGSTASVLGVPGFTVYAATKAALRSFARTWAVELGPRGIRVNVIQPGVVVTPGYETELGMTRDQVVAFEKEQAALNPLQRTGTPADIAAAVAFLASDDAGYITGAELFADGGFAQV